MLKIYNEDSSENDLTPDPNAEIIGEFGGGFDDTSITLSVLLKGIDRQQVSELLGVEPTKAWNPYERHPIGYHGRTRVVDWGKWFLKGQGSSVTESVGTKIESLLGRCTSDLKKWSLLTEKSEIYITVSGHLKNWNRELLLSSHTLKLLSDRQISLQVDVYFWEDDELPKTNDE